MNGQKFTRRDLMKFGAQATVAGSVLVLAACGKGGSKSACYDASKLTSGEKSLRDSLHYTDNSPDQAKTCSGCSFFEAAEGTPGCGHCKILNGPVAGTGHCDSWSAKA
jgi:hypothetical protein